MQQGELILRDPIKDEGYWVVLLLVAGGLWAALEKAALPRDILTPITWALVLAAVVLRLTVLRSWHVYTLPWTLDDQALTVGSRVVPIRDISWVGLKKGFLVRDSFYLIIRGRHTLRLAALIRGQDQDRSLQGIREMGWAVKQAVERLDGED